MYVIADDKERIMGQGDEAISAASDCYFGAGGEKVPCPIQFNSIGAHSLPEGWTLTQQPFAHRVRNFTPHDLVIYPPDGVADVDPVAFASCGVARAVEHDKVGGDAVSLGPIRVPLVRREYATVEGLPAIFGEEGREDASGEWAIHEDDVVVVSIIAAQALAASGRLREIIEAGAYVVTPDTGPGGVVRDSEGRIAGTRRLVLVTS